MAELSREELEQIVEKEMPGFVLVQPGPEVDTPSFTAAPDAVAPDLDTLREQLLGEEANSVEAEAVADAAEGHEPEDVVEDALVLIEPKNAQNYGPGPKAVIVSGAEKKIIGVQG